jgi:pullulanase
VTINAIIEEVHKTHPNVIFYGEGWTMGTQVTKQGYDMTTQANSAKTPGFAFFSDTIRDAMKGSVFNNTEKGYISGAGSAAVIGQCFMGAPSWTKNPTQIINYASCHDNMSLFDRITMSTAEDTVEDRIRMNNLAAVIYMTSQGVPFMQAGEEILRSKPLENGSFDHNSYKSPDSVNSIKWNDLNDAVYMDVYNYYKGLIAFRKAHPALRMTTNADVTANITAIDGLAGKTAAFQIAGGANGDSAEGIIVIFNPAKEAVEVALPEGNWNVYVDAEDAGTTALRSVEGNVSVAPISAMVLIREDNVVAEPEETTEATEPTEPTDSDNKGGLNVPAIVAGVAAAAAAAVGVAAVVLKKKKQ